MEWAYTGHAYPSRRTSGSRESIAPGVDDTLNAHRISIRGLLVRGSGLGSESPRGLKPAARFGDGTAAAQCRGRLNHVARPTLTGAMREGGTLTPGSPRATMPSRKLLPIGVIVGRPKTVGSLREQGYRSRSVKQEMRENLIARLRSGEPLFPGIIGYDDTVIPQVVNAILSRHDMLFLGLRGQAKTRMIRALPMLLDEWTPSPAGSDLPDDPLAPKLPPNRRLLEEHGDELELRWLHREERFHEKLTTPDVTIADLIGEIDLVKHAEGRHLADEGVLHYGLIPRTNRGIFAINELPDLPPRIQVGLFNALEERDVQIRGFPVRMPLDLCMAFTANPEDYTSRGRIVTPLKDRIGSVIRTH